MSRREQLINELEASYGYRPIIPRFTSISELEDLVKFSKKRETQEKPKMSDISIRVEIVDYSLLKKVDISNPKYNTLYNLGNYKTYLGLIYKNGELLDGWESVFSKRGLKYKVPLRDQELPYTENGIYTYTINIYEYNIKLKTVNKETVLNDILKTRELLNESYNSNILLSYDYTVLPSEKTNIKTTSLRGLTQLTKLSLKRNSYDIIEDGKCVYNALINSPALKRLRFSDKKWLSVFDKIEGSYTLTEVINKLFIPYDISVICYDSIGDIIYKNINKKSKQRILVLEISNGHMYEDLPNGLIRTNLLHRAEDPNISPIIMSGDISTQKCDFCDYRSSHTNVSIHKLEKHDKRPIINMNLDETDFNDIITGGYGKSFNLLKKNVIIKGYITYEFLGSIIAAIETKPYVTMRSGNIAIVDFSCVNLTFINDKHDDYLDYIAKSLNIEYNLQSLETILFEHFNKMCPNNKSTLTKQYYDMFDKNLPSAYRCLINGPSYKKNIYCIDVKNAYPSIMCNFNMPVYNKLDKIEQYDNKPLCTGYYYLSKPVNNILNSTGWYPSPLLEGYKEYITHQYLPSSVLDKQDSYNFIKDMSKIINVKEINKIIGKMRLCHYNSIHGKGFTSDPRELRYLFDKKAKDHIELKYTQLDTFSGESSGVYMFKSYEKRSLDYNALPIYCYIIQLCNLYLLDITRQLEEKNIKVLAYYTDAVYYEAKQPAKIISTYKTNIKTDGVYIGSYKPSELSNIPSDIHVYKKHKNAIIYNPEIQNISMETLYTYDENNKLDLNKLLEHLSNHSNLLLSGCAGSGKTYLIKELTKHFDKNSIRYKIISHTNNACSQYDNAKTIHREFGLEIDQITANANLINKINRYEYLIIDEYSMTPSLVYNYLLLLKEHTDTKFIFVGDHEQLASIDDIDCINNDMVKSLYDNVMIRLNYSNRIKNKEFLNYLLNTSTYTKDDLSKYVNVYHKNDISNLKQSTYHLCTTNKRRENIIKAIHGKTLQEKKELQLGDKIMGLSTCNKIITNCHYIVHEIRDDFIVLKYNTEINDRKYKNVSIMRPGYEVDNNIIKISKNDLYSYTYDKETDKKIINGFLFEYSTAFTIWKSQGSTINNKIGVHIDRLKIFDDDTIRRLIYVALSRVSDPSMIDLYL